MAIVSGGKAATPIFFPDDPIAADNDRAVDAGAVEPIAGSDYYDFIENTFFTPGEAVRTKAANVNTLDEVPDSSWFTNRIGAREMSVSEIVRGPDRVERLSIEGWPLVRDKGEGLQAGFRVADPESGKIYQIEFDPASNPEMATGAETIGTAFYHAFGYNVVDVYLVELDFRRITISPRATIADLDGGRRPFTRADLEDILRRSARLPNGRYRALASRFADGTPLGNFRYHGTRPDDPNDIFEHEHRRELRGSRVFAAWLNHDDSRGVNSLDMLEGEKGRQWVKHYMFDFGSIMGSGTAFAQTPRGGNEYLLDWREGFLTLATFGLYLRPWLLIDYPKMPPSVGRFESDAFDPEDWKPEYPNPAFLNMRADDAYWGAKIVAKFSDEAIRRVVDKAQYSDPRAADYITRTLVARRDKVLREWLNAVLPVDDLRLSGSGELTFRNTAVEAGVATAPPEYRLRWYRFDNATGAHEPAGEEFGAREPRATLPADLASEAFVAVAMYADHPEHEGWKQMTRVYFRKNGSGAWDTVGIERMDELAGHTRQ